MDDETDEMGGEDETDDHLDTLVHQQVIYNGVDDDKLEQLLADMKEEIELMIVNKSAEDCAKITKQMASQRDEIMKDTEYKMEQ